MFAPKNHPVTIDIEFIEYRNNLNKIDELNLRGKKKIERKAMMKGEKKKSHVQII